MKKKPDILVLNRAYIPIHVIDWKKAMSLIYQESAKPLDRDLVTFNYKDWLDFSTTSHAVTYPKVQSVNNEIAIPEIIVLQKYDRLPKRDVKFSRQSLFERDKFRCAYCGDTFKRSELTVDHIIPRAQGGKTSWDNTISSCMSCNGRKADKTPFQANMKLLFQPKKPRWISPIANITLHHPCKSWLHFWNRTCVEE